jgi:hypothetical protein
VHSSKLELEHFLNKHGVNICILSESLLHLGQAFWLANCLPPHRRTAGGATATLAHHGVVHHSVPVPGLTHLEANAIQIMLAGRLVNVLAAYLSTSCPLIRADLDACFGGWLLVLLAGDLNIKHVDWNSRLSTRKGKLLCNCADENSCLIFGPDSPTTIPYNPSAILGVLDIVITRHLPSLMQLTSYSAPRSDHLPILIDTTCRSSFQHSLDRPDVRRSYRVYF